MVVRLGRGVTGVEGVFGVTAGEGVFVVTAGDDGVFVVGNGVTTGDVGELLLVN